MSDNSRIEWCDATWNPTTGCTKVSPGCDNCYAESLYNRFNGPGAFDTVTLHPERLDQPLRWRKPRRVFVNSMSDLFHDDVPDVYIAKVFAVMALAPQHTFQVLTKRHGRMRSLLSSGSFRGSMVEYDPVRGIGCAPSWTWPLPNVWLGVSVESQKWADIRIPALLDTPAAVRFLSCEPLIGPVDLTSTAQRVPVGGGPARRSALSSPCSTCGGWGGPPSCPDDYHFVNRGGFDPCIDWVIVGAESGRGARPMDEQWARDIKDQCVAAGVPFFLKQYAVNGRKVHLPELDGRQWAEYPAERTAVA